MPGFPRTRVVKMRYVTSVVLNPGLGTIAKHEFRANSIFDPDYTGIGHQPIGHDQWANFYDRYIVIGSKINCKYIYDGTVVATPNLIGCYLTSDPNNTPSEGLEIAEQGLGRYSLVPTVKYAVLGRGTPQLGNTYSPKKLFNLSNLKDNQQEYGASYGANPTENAHYVIWTQNTDATALAGDTTVLVTIDYSVLLSDPKPLAQS